MPLKTRDSSRPESDIINSPLPLEYDEMDENFLYLYDKINAFSSIPTSSNDTVDIKTFLDGQSGRPTLAAWNANKTIDVGASVLAANSYAQTVGKPLLVSDIFNIGNTTIPYLTPILGVQMRTSGFKTTISNGNPVISIGSPTRQDHWVVRNISIKPLTTHVYGTDTYQNYIGLQTANLSCRFQMDQIEVMWAKFGIKTDGWIGDIGSLWLYYNDVGYYATNLNSADMWVMCEINRIGVHIASGARVTIRGICEDQSEAGVRLDQAYGCTIFGTYFEHNGVYDIVVGGDSNSANRAKNNTIIGGGTATTSTSIKVDYASNTAIRDISTSRNIVLTPNSSGTTLQVRPIISEPFAVTTNISYPLADFSNIGSGQIFNHFPNPNFVGGARGSFDAVNSYNATWATTSIFSKNGESALAVTPTTTSGNNKIQFTMNSQIRAWARNKKVLIGGWVYIPNNSDFNVSTNYNYPGLALFATTNDGTTTHYQSSAFGIKTYVPGALNFMASIVSIPDETVTNINVVLYTNWSSTVPTNTDPVIFSGVILTDYTIGNTEHLLNENIKQHADAGFFNGPSYIGYTTTNPSTFSGVAFQAGDKFINTAYTPGGTRSWTCSVSGIGNTATWIDDFAGLPALPIQVLAQSGSAIGPTTGTVASSVDTELVRILLPANKLGPNGSLRITILHSHNNSGNMKQIKIKMGLVSDTATRSMVFGGQVTSSQSGNWIYTLRARDATHQVSFPGGNGNIYTSSGAAAVITTFDLRYDNYIYIDANLNAIGDWITLEGYTIELLPGS